MISVDELYGLRCCIYVRVSTQLESQRQSLEAQLYEGRDCADDLGMNIIDEYIDDGISGTSIENRGAFQRLLEDSDRRLWDVVIFKDESRISRNQFDWFMFTRTIARNDQYMYNLLDHKLIDPGDLETSDKLLYNIKSLMAEDFSITLSKKMKAYNKRRQQEGILNFTTSPFGWTRVDRNTLIINEKEAEYIRYAVHRVIDGAGWAVICRELMEMGCLYHNKPLFPSTLQRIVLSPRIYGCVELNKKSKVLGKKRSIKNEPYKWIRVDGAIPGIIDKQLYDKMINVYNSRVHRIGVINRKNNFYKLKQNKYPLSGKIVCGVCGEHYTRKVNKRQVDVKNKQKKRYEQVTWVCRSYSRLGNHCNNFIVDENKLISIINDVCAKRFSEFNEDDNSLINKIMKMLETSLGDDNSEKEYKQVEKEIESNKRKLSLLLDKLLECEINNSIFQEKQRELEDIIGVLENKREALRKKVNSKLEKRERLDKIKSVIIGDKILEKARGIGYIELIDKIVVKREDSSIEIHYNEEKIVCLVYNYPCTVIKDECNRVECVAYDGWIARTRKSDNEKREILAIVEKNPTLSYSKIGSMCGLSPSVVKSRLRTLKYGGYIERGENNEIIIKKSFTGRG